MQFICSFCSNFLYERRKKKISKGCILDNEFRHSLNFVFVEVSEVERLMNTVLCRILAPRQ